MGLVCAIERRIKSIHTHAHYNYNLTGIPAYDKVYHECQKHADRFAELKLKYEQTRDELVSAAGAEIITTEVYAEAMDAVMKKILDNDGLEKNSIQFIEKHPFLLVDAQANAKLIKSLQPTIKFIMVLQRTQQELSTLETFLQILKKATADLFQSYKENAEDTGLDDFDRLLGREYAKKNKHLMACMLQEVKAYNSELQMISAAVPKYLSKAKERIEKKFERDAKIEATEKEQTVHIN